MGLTYRFTLASTLKGSHGSFNPPILLILPSISLMTFLQFVSLFRALVMKSHVSWIIL